MDTGPISNYLTSPPKRIHLPSAILESVGSFRKAGNACYLSGCATLLSDSIQIMFLRSFSSRCIFYAMQLDGFNRPLAQAVVLFMDNDALSRMEDLITVARFDPTLHVVQARQKVLSFGNITLKLPIGIYAPFP